MTDLSHIADYHVHTRWCGHGTGEIREFIERAIEIGLGEIGISEHLPIPVPLEEKMNLSESEMEEFAKELLRLRDEYRSQIVVKFGGECDYIPGQEGLIQGVLKKYPFDYVIGSVHFLNEWAFDHPKFTEPYRRVDLLEIWTWYFQTACDAAETGFFDIIGHPDVIKKFGFRPGQAFDHLHREFAQTLARAKICFEVNTAGLDKPVKEMYPSPELLAELRRCEVPVTLGSDAHQPLELCRYFERALALLKEHGFTESARFTGRQRTLTPLPCGEPA